MSSHSKSGAIIGLDSSMGFNHAAVMFGGHHAAKRRSRPSLQGGERRRRSPSPSSKRANGRHPDADVDVEPVDMTPPEERLTNHAVRCVGYEEAHDFDNLVLGRTHCLALAQLCFGKLHPEVTLAHCRLAHAYLRKGLFPQAEGHAQAALERLDQCDHGTSADPIRFVRRPPMATPSPTVALVQVQRAGHARAGVRRPEAVRQGGAAPEQGDAAAGADARREVRPAGGHRCRPDQRRRARRPGWHSERVH